MTDANDETNTADLLDEMVQSAEEAFGISKEEARLAVDLSKKYKSDMDSLINRTLSLADAMKVNAAVLGGIGAFTLSKGVSLAMAYALRTSPDEETKEEMLKRFRSSIFLAMQEIESNLGKHEESVKAEMKIPMVYATQESKSKG